PQPAGAHGGDDRGADRHRAGHAVRRVLLRDRPSRRRGSAGARRARAGMSPFGSLDFVYEPSRDVAAELRRFVEDLGATPVFGIEAFGARVAMLRLGDSPPAILLA